MKIITILWMPYHRALSMRKICKWCVCRYVVHSLWSIPKTSIKELLLFIFFSFPPLSLSNAPQSIHPFDRIPIVIPITTHMHIHTNIAIYMCTYICMWIYIRYPAIQIAYNLRCKLRQMDDYYVYDERMGNGWL